ncbi:restriction endonuclease, partial [Thiomonas sp.]|uniref:restriction endonuclease n=1 Tax=Thiomonas sp. TaxID=2047785 RepID=UPI002605A65F
ALQASPLTVFLATLIRNLSGFALALFALLSVVGLVQEWAAKRRTVTAPKPVDPWHNVPWSDTRPLPSPSSARTPVSARSAAASLPKDAAMALSLDLLREIEWHRFEQVCAAYWRETGMDATITPFGADGGVDVELRQVGADTPEALVQCKAWNASQVGVKLVRELLGVVTDRKVERGIFMSTGTFTTDAAEFARGNRLELIDGSDLVRRINALPVDAQARLLALATDGNYVTPTCPACGIKMVLREGKEGSRAFWGCRNYPKGCRQTLQVARSAH